MTHGRGHMGGVGGGDGRGPHGEMFGGGFIRLPGVRFVFRCLATRFWVFIAPPPEYVGGAAVSPLVHLWMRQEVRRMVLDFCEPDQSSRCPSREHKNQSQLCIQPPPKSAGALRP